MTAHHGCARGRDPEQERLDELVVAERERGLTLASVAAALGVTSASVYARIGRVVDRGGPLGLRARRAEVAAHLRSGRPVVKVAARRTESTAFVEQVATDFGLVPGARCSQERSPAPLNAAPVAAGPSWLSPCGDRRPCRVVGPAAAGPEYCRVEFDDPRHASPVRRVVLRSEVTA